MISNYEKVEQEKYFNSYIIKSTGEKLKMNDNDKEEYLSLLTRIPFICVCNSKIIQMNLKQVGGSVYFNGLVAKELNGGYYIDGAIRLEREVVEIKVDFDNNNNYEQFIITFDEINKGKVKLK